ncbi:MAG: RagB/SusD family nutrient uptake outer membrane protein [Bacteroidales bacterium]|nr:RagB/SusD family nutrient uptake outer membrane protein [Bacteroidales bacterium]
MKKIYIPLLALCALGTWNACVDADIDDALAYEDTYTNSEDADYHILGIYSQFMQLAEQMVVLNELRGDLMTITPNANDYLQQVEANQYNAENPYFSTQPYYSIIANCNDALTNFDKMLERHDMTKDEYAERYSDVQAIRCYVYLQLAAQFGKVYYLDEAITTLEQYNSYAASAHTIGLDELLPKLITCMENVPTLEDYEQSSLVINGTSSVTLDGQVLKHYFINKKLVLADLYLWAGRSQDDYRKAAYYYKEVMNKDATAAETANSLYYRCNTFTYTGSTLPTSASQTSNNYCAGNLRYLDQDERSFFTTWPYMFEDAVSSSPGMYEWIWTMTYTPSGEPQYPFIDLFESASLGGSYQLRPSANYIAETQRLDVLRKNGAPYDPRGFGALVEGTDDYAGATFRVDEGDTVCAKYLYLYDADEPNEKTGRIWLYRAAGVHLRFAEAINRAGYPDMAYGFLMGGPAGYFGSTYPTTDMYGNKTTTESRPQDYKGLNASGDSIGMTRNLFGLRFPISTGICDNETDSALLYFDTRYYTSATSNLYEGIIVRGPWRSASGLRGRQLMAYKTTSNYSTKSLSECTNKADSIYLIEKIIMDESALELGHEGQRFPDLVRVARRMNGTGSVTVNGQAYALTNDGMTGSDYLKTVIGGKEASTINVLGAAQYTDQDSWFIQGE